MVELTNNEGCLIHDLCAEKHWGSVRIIKIFSNK